MSEILEVPNSWRAGVITKDGLGLLSKLVKGHTLDITRAETGAGWVDPELLQQQTAVTNPMQALSFEAVSYPEEGKCMIPCELSNVEITTSYIARQIGVYANDPDKGEILYYITQVEDENGGTGIPSRNLIPSYTATWDLVIYYGMADGVSVTVNPAGLVSRVEMESYVDASVAELSDKVGSAIIRSITIPAADWSAVEDMGDYKYSVDVAMEDAKETHFPILALDIPSLDIAGEAEMCPTIETLDGFVRFWAKEIPTADLTGSIMLRSENLTELDDAGDTGGDNGSGTNSEYEVATDKEVENILSDIFG